METTRRPSFEAELCALVAVHKTLEPDWSPIRLALRAELDAIESVMSAADRLSSIDPPQGQQAQDQTKEQP